MATKADLDALRSATKTDLSELKAELITKLGELQRWMMTTVLSALVLNGIVVLGGMFGLAKLLGH